MAGHVPAICFCAERNAVTHADNAGRPQTVPRRAADNRGYR